MARALRGCDGADGVAAGWVGHGPEGPHAQEDRLDRRRDRRQGVHRHSHRHRHREVRQGGGHRGAGRQEQDGRQTRAAELQEEDDAHPPQGAEGSAYR